MKMGQRKERRRGRLIRKESSGRKDDLKGSEEKTKKTREPNLRDKEKLKIKLYWQTPIKGTLRENGVKGGLFEIRCERGRRNHAKTRLSS